MKVRPAFELADVFRRHGESYERANAGHLGRVERRVIGSDHGLPHGGARRPCRALRRLRAHPHLLQLVQKPPLRQVSGGGARGVARGAAGRAAAGSLLPRRLHPAAGRGRDRLPEQADGLRPADARGGRGAHDARRRAPRRQDRPDRRLAHLGTDADPSSPCPLSRPRRRRRPRRPAMGRLQTQLPALRPRSVEDIPPALPGRPGGSLPPRRTRLLRRTRPARRPRRLRRARARARESPSSSTPSRRSADPSACWPISPATRIAPRSPIRGSSPSTTITWRSPTRIIAAAAAAASCASPRTSSSAGSCCTSCPTASTAFVTMAFSPRATEARPSRACAT